MHFLLIIVLIVFIFFVLGKLICFIVEIYEPKKPKADLAFKAEEAKNEAYLRKTLGSFISGNAPPETGDYVEVHFYGARVTAYLTQRPLDSGATQTQLFNIQTDLENGKMWLEDGWQQYGRGSEYPLELLAELLRRKFGGAQVICLPETDTAWVPDAFDYPGSVFDQSQKMAHG